ncbi:MAG: FadR/GntR family transcriptional regulator [Streptosporangiales bacterium]
MAGRQAPGRTRGVELHRRVVAELGQHLATLPEPAGTVLEPVAIGARLGASRTAVREALRVLQAKGMITARPHVGTRVRAVGHWDLTDPDVIGWLAYGPHSERVWRELFELRIAVEPVAARLAAAQPEGGSVLVEAAGRMRDAAARGDTEAYTGADTDFHQALLTGSGNRVFTQFTAGIVAMLRAQCELVLSVREVSQESVALHSRVARAVARGNAQAAERHTRLLLAGVAERVLDTLRG